MAAALKRAGWVNALGAVALALGLAACAAGAPPAADPSPADPPFPVSDVDPDEVDRSFVMSAHVDVRATGAATFAWAGEHDVQVIRLGRLGDSVNLLSLGFLLAVPTTEDEQNGFRWAFDLHDYDDAPGSFVIDQEPVNDQGVKDLAFLVWVRTRSGSVADARDADDLAHYAEFHVRDTPCEVQVGPDVFSGSMRCPELIDEAGRVASLQVDWRDGRWAGDA